MNPLLRVWGRPEQISAFSPTDWDTLLRSAHAQHAAGRLGHHLEEHGLIDAIPPKAREILEAARFTPRFLQVQVQREMRAVRRALAPLGVELILLKGAAYLERGLSFAQGRAFADLDLLVRQADLEMIEQHLLERSWEAEKPDSYDQHYYRAWMHEIPPLRHRDRDVEVDIHHNLLPQVSRLHLDPTRLWEASVPLGTPGLRVLSPADMLLHTAIHLFQDGEIKGGLKDLLDIHGMLEAFPKESGFFDGLLNRARDLGLGRPLYHALKYAQLLVAAPLPPWVLREAHAFAPVAPVDALMESLVTRVLDPHYPMRREPVIAQWLLYVRSHWLRMPPGLLASHLTRKAWRRVRTSTAAP